MNELQVFNNEELGQVKTVEANGNILFCSSDVAKALGYSRPADAIKAHCKGVVILPTPTNGGIQKVKYITEGDLYRLIAHSKLPSAEKFEIWVYDEVLPSIRKHGAYMTNSTMDKVISDPDFGIRLLTELKAEREKREELERTAEVQQKQIEELRPKANYTDMILQNPGLVNVNQIAADYGMSAIAMNKLLHEKGIQYKQGDQWILYKKYKNKGYVGSETFEFKHSDGTKDTNMRTKWTQRGRFFLYELLKKEGIRPIIETEFETTA